MLGLRAAPLIRDPNMTPRPAPTPARAMVAQPAPTILEAARMLMARFWTSSTGTEADLCAAKGLTDWALIPLTRPEEDRPKTTGA